MQCGLRLQVSSCVTCLSFSRFLFGVPSGPCVIKLLVKNGGWPSWPPNCAWGMVVTVTYSGGRWSCRRTHSKLGLSFQFVICRQPPNPCDVTEEVFSELCKALFGMFVWMYCLFVCFVICFYLWVLLSLCVCEIFLFFFCGNYYAIICVEPCPLAGCTMYVEWRCFSGGAGSLGGVSGFLLA